MVKYYQMETTPGIKLTTEQIPREEKFAYLDLDEIKNRLLDFSDSGISKVRFFIPGIHCASCIWLLENLHTLHEGVIQSSVNFPKKEVSITFREEEISLRQLVELLASIHYIPEINTKDEKEESKATKNSRTLLLKVGIAGFSFLNAMLYHFPQYLTGSEHLEANFRLIFGWLSFILSLPVLFYCANDYFLSAYKSLRKKIISIDLPIALGLITLFIQSSYELISNQGIGYFDSLTGLVFFLLIGKWYQSKTYEALTFERDYKSYFPVAVTKVTKSGNETIPMEHLKAGDRIIVRNQELIPADSTVEKGNASIDYSFVTGESIPVTRNIGDFVFAGGRQIGSAIELLVQKEVEQSYLTQLWNQDQSSDETTPMSGIINKVSQYFTLVIISVALLAAIYWNFTDPGKALFAFTSVLIIACPCALALTIPFTFGSTMRQFGRRGFYLKNTDVIERLHKIKTVVFDKTGTITHTQSSKIEFIGEKLTEEQLRMIKSLVFHSTHPLSKTIYNFISEEGKYEVTDYKEITSLGITGMVNGKKVNLGSKYFVTGSQQKQNDLKTQVWVFMEDKVLGYFQFENNYRKGLTETINNLSKNYELHLISGDNEAEKENLEQLFPSSSTLNFNQSPTDKLQYIKNLQKNGEATLMIGDGLNDAGALNESKVGVVIADNIYNFTPACDAILQAGKFASLHRFIQFTHTSMKVVWISFVISFLYNVIGISFAVQGNLSPIIAAILMPASSVSVVAFATFSIKIMFQKQKL